MNLPPGAQIRVNFLTDPTIKHRKITFPPQTPVNVNFPTPACIKAQSSHLPEKAQATVPSDLPIMHYQVHSSSIPDILGMTSPSTACAFTPQPSASTQHRDALQPRVKKRRARVRCIKLSPAQAKVKKRSYAAINKDKPPLPPAPILLLPCASRQSLRQIRVSLMQILVELPHNNSNPTLWYSRNLQLVCNCWFFVSDVQCKPFHSSPF
jgi:hypothetical protein